MPIKGIILAGGSGTRLYPSTLVTSKQLMPIYDKPMIYYPLSTLMLAGIKDILIITTPEDNQRFKQLLGDGSMFGINISYATQVVPNGLAQAFIIGEHFIGKNPCALILGDNIFYGAGLTAHLRNSIRRATVENKCTIFGYYVKDPQRYGIVELDKNKNAISIEEKPKKPKSNYCVTGLYFYPRNVVKKAKQVKPSARGEYEITALNNLYLDAKKIHVTTLGRGYTWLDTGTHDSLLEASEFVRLMEEHQGIKISCPEEIAYINGWISKKTILERGKQMKNNDYGQHLLAVAQGKILYSTLGKK